MTQVQIYQIPSGGAIISGDLAAIDRSDGLGGYLTKSVALGILAAQNSITSDNIDGVISIDKGGTGSTTTAGFLNNLLPSQTGNSGKALSTDGTTPFWANGLILPSQTGNAGKYLTTDGVSASWGDNPLGTVTSFAFTNANGITGNVSNPTTTPTLSLSLGAITPTSVAASGAMSGSNLSGTNTGDQTIALTGDVTGSGTGSFAATLATVNSNVGSFTNASITVNAKGLITAASSGTAPVTSVTGTTDRIAITGTTTAVIDIAATYVGQTSITTLGTIATGTWSATAIATTKGGTGLTSYNQGDLLYASAANTLAALAKDTNATRYLSNTGTSNNPAWAQVALSTGISGFGTGVATALAVNTGSAGAPVLFNGALGTPSSGTATNLTGTATALNIGGNAATATSATSATTATNATNTAITEDTSTNASVYPTWVTANTGNLPQKTTSTKLSFNPSTGILSSTSFTGAGTGLTGTAASLTAGTASAVALGGITGLGTGVATALAVNTGSAGAFVVNGGAGGTPSSITLTNGTGLPTTGLTGTLQAAQEPAHTGDVTNSAGSLATTVAAIAGTTVSGTTGTTNVMFSASPTTTGTLTAAAISASGIVTGATHVVTGSTAATNGIYLPAANTVGISANSIDVARFATVASGVNYFNFTPGAAGSPGTLIMGATGTDTNIRIRWQAKGTAFHQFENTNSGTTTTSTSDYGQLRLVNQSNTVNGLNRITFVNTNTNICTAISGVSSSQSAGTGNLIFTTYNNNTGADALTLSNLQVATFASDVNAVGNFLSNTAAKGLVLKQGANGKCGTFVANGITPVTVSNSSIAITDTIIISLNTVGGTVGVQPHVATITASSGFTVVCTATDTSTYNYAIISNAA